MGRRPRCPLWERAENSISVNTGISCPWKAKNNASGIRFVKGRLYWNGLIIQPQVRKGDNYARESLAHRVKYCRIVWKPVGSRPQFYLQLILEGRPPAKHTMGGGRCGIDIGPSTVAAVSAKRCTLKVLAEEAVPAEKERARLMRVWTGPEDL